MDKLQCCDNDRIFDNDFCRRGKTTTRVFCCFPSRRTRWGSREWLLEMYVLGKRPKLITCPNCRAVQETYVVLKCTKKTHFMAALLTLVLLCWLPYCTRRCRIAVHYCRACKAYIGRS
ncbi:uncharacterized protein LOC108907450 [Anoplophora glabripennis]|uniref:uncharacterized protein LOC108907450 n=1 Tax=Anoplophora glabripennis TaxID=217634 RepID=UPI000874A147|nr:uncharacterized protein LOC108907450 [Anoplophora glabripennis]